MTRAENYARRAEEQAARASALEARSGLVSNLRGLSFGIAVIAGLFALFGDASTAGAAISAAAFIAFLGLIGWHARIIEREEEARRWVRVNRDAEARCTGKWRTLPEDGRRFADPAHPYAGDLDLFGPGSLYQRTSVAHTHFGQKAYADVLKTPVDPARIRRRQAAAKALSGELDLRQRFEALALALMPPQSSKASSSAAVAPPDPEPLLRWAETEPLLSKRWYWRWLAWSLPALTISGFVAASFGVPLLWAPPLFLQLVVVFLTRERTFSVFSAVSATEGAFLRYGSMLALLEQLPVRSELIDELGQRLGVGELRPSLAMQEFRRGVGWFDLRHNGLVHPFVNALLLWDLHCVLRLERWQQRAGRRAQEWFEVLGEFEALSCAAGLAYDEPEFAFPEIVEDQTLFEAEALGHPLIDAAQRVPNDVSLPGAGSALLVTGSNMSGKSTLMRAMGLACVMALGGLPVCAKRLRLCPLAVRTSIQVADSLQTGVSHFYAELHKLKTVVDATRSSLPVFFLLDEVLHGTNSRERQVGARWVMGELIERGAIGAVSTHDQGLAQLPEPLMERVGLVHFRESVQDGKMTFDFKLRPGPVTSGNALRLMRLVGLDVPLQ